MAAGAVILDIDGTLVDSNDAHARAWVDAFAEAGVPVPYDRVRRAIGMGGDKLIPHLLGITAESPAGQRITQRRAEIFKSRYRAGIRPFPRVRELVERFIADGFTIAVATSAKREELRSLLESAGVADLIDASTSADDAESSKPDPDIVEAALKRLNAPRDCAIMLGDTPYDVEAARRAGIPIVALECGGWPGEDLQGAAEIYRAPAELLERYDQSLFARIAREGHLPFARTARRSDVWWFAIPLIAIGTALVIAEAVRRRRRVYRYRGEGGFVSTEEFGDAPADVPREREAHHPTLGPRDRERLRKLIARTS